MKKNVVVAITGASGVTYAIRLLEVLSAAGCDVDLSISTAAREVLRHELDLDVDLDGFDLSMLRLDRGGPSEDEKLRAVKALAGITSDESDVLAVGSGQLGAVRYHHFEDLTAPITSGTYLTGGMVICPCSMGTLSAIVHGTGGNLIHRAADVHLKEGRKLILVPRETPLSVIQLGNMTRAAEAGAVVLPAMPGFYHGVTSVQDLVDFVVARICDQLQVENLLINRWGGNDE